MAKIFVERFKVTDSVNVGLIPKTRKVYGCALRDDKPQVCKDFPSRQGDIDTCGSTIGERTKCVAEVGGAKCNRCGQCCRDKPWPSDGCPETGGESWLSDECPNECVHLVLESKEPM
jgi:hypothetical protein